MSKVVFILGRDHRLSLAELQSLYPEAIIEFWNTTFALFDAEKRLADSEVMKRLGGIMKVAVIQRDTTSSRIAQDLADLIAGEGFDSGKIVYGVSVYGVSERDLKSLLMDVKRAHRKQGIKSRFINKGSSNISAAQYWHHLNDGKEFIVVKAEDVFYLGEAVFVQDIDGYGLRDYGKPFRNMRMGMLPPKLAQILLNLSCVQPGQTVWDPFCGSGTIAMEGALMGLKMMGSDIDEAYVAGARQNIDWLRKNFSVHTIPDFFVHDATHSWTRHSVPDAVVFEGDLGPPLSPFPLPEQLRKIMEHLHDLYIRFFAQCKKQLKKDTVIVAALPFFMADRREVFLTNTIEAILEQGIVLDPLLAGDQFYDFLTYRRPDQAVGRAIYRFRTS